MKAQLPGNVASSPTEVEDRTIGAIKRRQLFELHDLPWWPKCLRQSLTDVLILAWGFPWIRFRRNGVRLIPSLASLCSRVIDRAIPPRNTAETDSTSQSTANCGSGPTVTVVDLCSGSGGPWNEICAELQRADLQVVLSDLYPPAACMDSDKNSAEKALGGSVVAYHRDCVDATDVAVTLRGMRTLFGGFHHFPPVVARAILQDAVNKREPIVVIESCERSLSQMIGAGLLMTPLALITPVVYFRRTPWQTFLFTYVIPITPWLAGFDGVASCMRAYTTDEMLLIANSVDGSDHYTWTAGKETFLKLFSLTFMIGRPRAELD